MKKLFIDVGDKSGALPEGYGCQFYFNLKDANQLFNLLTKTKNVYDGYVIHFDSLRIDILDKMIERGLNNNKYEVRIHNSDKGQYNCFWNYVNKYWINQEGWFKR